MLEKHAYARGRQAPEMRGGGPDSVVFERRLSLTKSHFLCLGQNRRLSGSLRRHAPLLLTRIAGVDSLVSQLIRDLEGELKLAVRQVTVFLDDG